MTLRTRTMSLGLRMGVPYSVLRACNDIVGWSPAAGADLRRRRRIGDRFLDADGSRATFIPRDKGFAPFDQTAFPGTAELASAAREYFAPRREGVLKSSRGRNEHNPFYIVASPEELSDFDPIWQVAFSRPVLEAVVGYFGYVPTFQTVGFWLSTPTDHDYGSQLFHLDKPEAKFLTMFISVTDTTDQNGPTTVLPADRSIAVRSASRYENLYYNGDGRLPDSALYANIDKSDLVRLTAPAGGGAFLDTSACLHCGSRCESGERLMLSLRFGVPKMMNSVLRDVVPDRFGADLPDDMRALLIGR